MFTCDPVLFTGFGVGWYHLSCVCLTVFSMQVIPHVHSVVVFVRLQISLQSSIISIFVSLQPKNNTFFISLSQHNSSWIICQIKLVRGKLAWQWDIRINANQVCNIPWTFGKETFTWAHLWDENQPTEAKHCRHCGCPGCSAHWCVHHVNVRPASWV